MYFSKRGCSKLVPTALFVLAASLPAHSQTISDLFNTGVDAGGVPLPTNAAVDPHWTNGAAGTAYTNYFGTYHAYTDADYITIDPNGGSGNYTATFNTTFTLPSNAILSSVAIVGNYSIDNVLDDILINGNSTGIADGNSTNFTTANPFALPTGFYQTGTNTLSVEWSNQGDIGAIAFEFTGKAFQTASVPEPGSFALLIGMGMAGAGFLACRRSQIKKTV